MSQFDLFPKSVDLIAVERKYSDSLTDEDITGLETISQPLKTKKNQLSDQTLTETRTVNQSIRI